ncbi:MGH1-like glycoside hydrolase domain-containing protein [Flavihumibacter fluvii]|uniref:MGH1-like glycoside hydrolase domain-containing protein n=1 Tax=Flavihumibacter fluvii TaxID=2838157 RepID=UPI001BDF0953|nr:glucosidase [Flavihumibacter fluvii]ULQ52873.1 glucosidase [Flavihumibacter fluvii]
MHEHLFQAAEQKRLDANAKKPTPLELWGPYLSERQWGTVREDYSANGDAWNYLTHDQARSKAYRWGEDGIAGISDYNQYLCFALTLWNHKDPILKERMFGLTNGEGNHGEDCKELYYFLDNVPTHSYMRMLYKYPQAAFPYEELVRVNREKGKADPEFEILDTGIFEDNRYFDVYTEYAKIDSNDIMIRITVINRSDEPAPLTVMPTLWFRNNWSFHPNVAKPQLNLSENEFGQFITVKHAHLSNYHLYFNQPADMVLFTENETNLEKLYGIHNPHPCVKDAFHDVIAGGKKDLLTGKTEGTKASPVYRLIIKGHGKEEIYLRLSNGLITGSPLEDPGKIFEKRIIEKDEFNKCIAPLNADADLTNIMNQAIAGLIWSKQFYYYDVDEWLNGDKSMPPPPPERLMGRNKEWSFLNNRDIILMPDTWEFPWYASWDLAFHCIPMAFVDPVFAKHQMVLLLREWYMSPMGQLPAYEWNFSDVNPPVHAWASLNIYRIEKAVHGRADVDFLKRIFQKLLINFTWWVNRKDKDGNNLFEGGFLGLDNIGVINRNEIPAGYTLEQVDGTSWMAMYALNMLDMALEIAKTDKTFEDVATKFYEHFVLISASLNEAHLWHKEDEFFYDVLIDPVGGLYPIRVRSVVGLSVLFGVSVIPGETMTALKDFERRTEWFKDNRKVRGRYLPNEERKEDKAVLLTLIHRGKLEKILKTLFDEDEFLAPGGIRGLSKYHLEHPWHYFNGDKNFDIKYDPAESTTDMFGGNSNWRGPIWLPINYLIIKSLKKYHQFYGDQFKVEFPTGSGNWMNLGEVSNELARRVISIFRKDAMDNRPVHSDHAAFYNRPENRNLVLFYEYFHGDLSRGVGASHQTGWTALVAELINDDSWEWE